MLIKKLPHFLIVALMGLLIACGSTNPMVDKAESSIKDQNYNAALTSAEKSIKQFPGDPLGYYYKGVALGGLAEQQDQPKAGYDYYQRMDSAFSKAKSLADSAGKKPKEIDRISAIKSSAWRREHNRAVKLATNDSLKKTVSNPMERSLEHLKNATVIEPDSSLSWDVLTQVSAMNKDYSTAIKAKNKYMELVPDSVIDAKDYIQLGSFYYQEGENDKVLETFLKGNQKFPENEKIVTNLADAYSRSKNPEKAIQTIQNLVNKYPDNAQYHLALGTQLYQQVLSMEGKPGEDTQKKEDLTNKAEKQLKKAIELKSQNPKAYNVLGIIYQNRAKAKFDMRNSTKNNAKASKYDKEGDSLLKKSMGYYEQATQLDPDNKEYWRSLFSIYTALGMDQKAQDAMKKAGMK